MHTTWSDGAYSIEEMIEAVVQKAIDIWQSLIIHNI